MQTIDTTGSQLAPRMADGLARTMDPAPVSLLSIMDAAVAKGVAPETLDKLLAVYERMEAGVARKAFFAAMAEFKRTCPPVERRTENPQFSVTRNGVKQNRKFASLEDIARDTSEPLAANGLSYRWGDAVVDGGKMTMSCIVSHVGGHSESSSITMPIESSAGCSVQQKSGIAETYAMRYSLIRALGLTTCDEDADGNDEPPPETITESQAADLALAVENVGGDVAKFCAALNVDRLSNLPAASLPRALSMVAQKRAAMKGGKV